MSNHCSKKKTEGQSSRALETDESHQGGLIVGDLLAQESHSVDPQQRSVTPELEQLEDHMTCMTAPNTGWDRIQSPTREVGMSGTATQVPKNSLESTIDSSDGQLIGDQPDDDSQTPNMK